MPEQSRKDLDDLLTTFGPSRVLSELSSALHDRYRVLRKDGEPDASLAAFEAHLVLDYQAKRLQAVSL